MSDEAIDDAAPKHRRGMLGFYVAGFGLLGLALFGAWFWNAWTNWQFDEYGARRRQAEAARQLGVPVGAAVDLGGGVALELVLIPPGMFDMGSPENEPGRWKGEGPVHRVRISRPFYMGKYEVTQEVWEKVMGANPSYFKGAKNPVDNVSWDDCQEFLRKLNAMDKNPRQFRLPTEAEWEWACRAGVRSRFCFGDDDARLGEYAWYAANSDFTTHPVGEKRPNAWGLHDGHGNVWEWCGDWYDEHGANAWPGVFRWTTDPVGPPSGAARVLRGGSLDDVAGDCRSAYRYGSGPDNRLDVPGFRVVVALSMTQ
jgi:formylglycine-generating enzyme required for sulfatase activity